MKPFKLLAVCWLISPGIILAEDSSASTNQTSIVKPSSESKPSEIFHWAYADKREIESAISQVSMKKMQADQKAENLTPEVEAKVNEYNRLNSQLMRLRMTKMRPPGAPAPMISLDLPVTTDYESLSNQVAQAREPIADILKRRSDKYSHYQDQITPDDLIAEYVKDRYDLVVDSSSRVFGQSAVLFRKAGDIPDITDGVLRLLKEKTK